MTTATKHGRMVTYNDEPPSIKSQDSIKYTISLLPQCGELK